MNMTRAYAEYATAEAVKLLNIDSPTGYTAQAAAWVKSAFEELGFVATLTRKGGVVIDLGGEDDADGLWLEAHADTLGGIRLSFIMSAVAAALAELDTCQAVWRGNPQVTQAATATAGLST